MADLMTAVGVVLALTIIGVGVLAYLLISAIIWTLLFVLFRLYHRWGSVPTI